VRPVTFSMSSAALARRVFIACALCLGAAAWSASAAPAFPTKPVRLMVGFPPGGGVDVAARALGGVLSGELGQSVIVENLAGAGGNIATDRVVKSAPDGYTLLFGSIALSINPSLYKSLSFDPVTQLRAVAMVSTSPYVLLAGAGSGIDSVQKLIARARAGEDIHYASAGNGSGSHLFMQQFADIAGIKMSHVPYRGAAPALNDVLGNQVPVVFDSIMTTLPHIRAGTLKALGLSSKKKSAIAPDIAPLDELGVQGMDSTSWFIIFAPAATEPAVMETLHQAINRSLKNPELQARFAAMGAEIAVTSMAEAQRFYESEVRKWAAVVKASGVRTD